MSEKGVVILLAIVCAMFFIALMMESYEQTERLRITAQTQQAQVTTQPK